MENEWLAWAKRLQAIASTGEFFGESDFDTERYQEITEIANAMLSRLGDVPIERIEALVPDHAQGYATPKVDVRAAVIRDDRILMVKERLDGKWTLPGGFADVGLSAATNVVKEVQEEASIAVAAERVYGLFHKAAHEYAQDARDFYKLYFMCRQLDTAEPAPGPETTEVGWFTRDDLPTLSTGRVIARHVDLAFDYHQQPALPVSFD